MAQQQDTIGTATMEKDGTLILNLRAEGERGEVGFGQLVYPPGHAQYQSILDHLGGLKVGESKLVRPWEKRP